MRSLDQLQEIVKWLGPSRRALLPPAAIKHPRAELLLGLPLIRAGLVVSAHDAGETAIRVEIAPAAHRLLSRVPKIEILPIGFPWRQTALLTHIILADKRIGERPKYSAASATAYETSIASFIGYSVQIPTYWGSVVLQSILP